MHRHKKLFLGITAAAVCCALAQLDGFAWLIPHAHAAPERLYNTDGGMITDALTFLGMVFNTVVFLTYGLIKILSVLLDPRALLDMEQVITLGGQPMLLYIWQFARDIVNVIFAFLLVFAALYTVITAKRDLIQQHIAKFVIAVVLVNFSWFFPRVVIDIANVLTATIYQIPNELGSQCQTWQQEAGNFGPCQYITDVWIFPEFNDDMPAHARDLCNNGNVGNGDNYVMPNDWICYELTDIDVNANTSLGIMSGLFLNHSRFLYIHNFEDFQPADPARAGDLGDQLQQLLYFAIRLVVVLLFALAIFFPLMAMAVVFLIRIPIIWLTTAFMPFMFVGIALGAEYDKLNITNMIWGHFWKAAFLPAALAAPITIGYVIINAGIVSICPNGSVVYGENGARFCSPGANFIPGIDNWWQLLWVLIALIVIWQGVFAAMKIDDIYAGISGTIKGIGESWGKFALKSPLALPGISLPGTSLAPGQVLSMAKTMAADPSRSMFDPKTGHMHGIEDLKKALNRGSGAPISASPGGGGGAAVTKRYNSLDVNTRNNIRLALHAVRDNQAGAAERLRKIVQENGLAMDRPTAQHLLRQMGGLTPKQLKDAMARLDKANAFRR